MRTMWNMFKISLVSLLLWGTQIQAQNFIYNGGFEFGDWVAANQDYYNGNPGSFKTVDFLAYWERAKWCTNTAKHSCDWSYEGFVPQIVYNFGPECTGTSFPPYELNGMVGMIVGELIQQEYDRDGLADVMEFSASGLVRLSFQVRLASYFPPGTQLKVYLAKKKLRYEAQTGSGPDYYSVSGNSNFIVASVQDDLGSLYSESEWREFEVLIPWSTLQEYKYIGIGTEPYFGDRETVQGTCEGYLRLDQVSLETYCEPSCYPTRSPLAVQVSSNWINSNSPLVITGLDNVTDVEFLVYKANGQTVYFNQASCDLGISQDIEWDGTATLGTPIANGVYKYILKVKNSCYKREYKGTFLKQTDYTGPPVQGFDFDCVLGPAQTPQPCCLEDLYMDNAVLVGPGYSPYIVQDNIWACTSVPDFSDEVVVKNGADVYFRAGIQITLAEGFHTEDGAIFLAEIDDCRDETWPPAFREVREEPYDRDTLSVFRATPPEQSNLVIYPNPTDGQLQLTLNFPGQARVQILVSDMYGRSLIIQNQPGLGWYEIDLSSYPNGIYYVTVVADDQRITRKVILQ